MGIFDRWNKPAPLPTAIPRPASPATPEVPARTAAPTAGELGVEKFAGPIGVTLLVVEDPFVTDVVNGHCTDAYRLGHERLLAVDVLLRNTSRSEHKSISAGKFHLFDDAHYMRQSLSIDSRAKAPALIEGFLMPGATARGWVTFCLPWERGAARLQFFTGYLGEGVVDFALPLLDAAARDRLRGEAAARRAHAEAAKSLAGRAREVEALEARAEAAQVLLAREAQVAALEERALRAREVIERAEALLARLDAASPSGGAALRLPGDAADDE